MLQSSLNWRTL